MKPSHDEPDINRLYLLGKLTGDGLEQFEERYFADDELFEDLEAAEDELIDDYLTGDLSEEDTSLFRENYLVGKVRQQKLRVGEAWRNHARNKAIESSRKKIERAPAWQWRQLLSSSPLRIAAFAAVILVAAVGVWRVFIFQSDVDKGLVALNAAYREQRPLEGRISQFDYAPFVTTRGPESQVDFTEQRRAELILLEALKGNPTSQVHHALGKLYLAKKEFDSASEQFQLALKSDPNNAQIYTDLGAAFLERGKLEISKSKSSEPSAGEGKGTQDLAKSLENLNKALQINPDLAEALFNRALVYEYMLLPKSALEAWKTYLAKDPNSQWAQEAHRRIQRLEAELNKASRTRQEIFQGFLTAYRNQDHDAAWLSISRHRDLSGGPVANTLIDEHLELAVTGQHDQALQKLNALSYVAQLERERAGDLYVSDIVRFLRSLPASRRNSLIEARQLIKQGRESIFQSDPEAAEGYYTKAKELLTQLGNTSEAIYVDYPLGHAYLGQSKSRLSLSNFDKVIAQCEAHQYKWLMAQALNAKANVEIGLRNHSTALDASYQSLKMSEQIGDLPGVIKTTNQLAQEYFYLGNYSKSLELHQRSLELSDANWTEPIQQWRNYFSLPRTLNAMGLHSAAIEYEKEAIRRAEDLKMPQIVCRSYSILGLMYAGQGNYGEAVRNIERSIELANQIPSETIRKESIAYSTLQLGLINRQSGEFTKALANYERAIQLYGELKDYEPFSYVAHKGKLLSCLNLDGCPSIEEEIRISLKLFEEFRYKILEQSNRDSFFDTEQSIYDLAIGYEFSRNNFKTAFDYSERARGRSLLDLTHEGAVLTSDVEVEPDVRFTSAQQPLNFEQIKTALPERAQILQYAVLEDKLLIWLIWDADFVWAQTSISAPALHEKLSNYLELLSSPSQSNSEGLTRDGMALYEILIKPIEASLDRTKLLCIVPDKTLSYLPFAALISPESGKYLMTDYELMYAPSSSMFIRSSEIAATKQRTSENLLAVGNPRIDQDHFELPDLPAASNEATSIRDLYGAGSTAFVGAGATKKLVKTEMGESDVVHLAVHSVVDEVSPMRSKLLLASSAGSAGDGVLHAYEIYGSKLPITRLVVLSACETGVGRYYRGEGMMGLSRTFIAADVPLVVSTLWRVDSESTADLMVAFHKNRKAGHSTSKALQMSQQAMANGSDQQYRSPYYWAGFTLAGGYADY